MEISLSKISELFAYDSRAPLIFNSSFFLFLFFGFLIIYLLIYHFFEEKEEPRQPYRNDDDPLYSSNRFLRISYTVAFSLFFYYKSSGIFFLLLIFSTLVDYTLGLAIHKTPDKGEKKIYLIISLVVNLGMLAVFKYANFFRENVVFFQEFIEADPLTIESWSDPWDIFLPVGISFYTFQTISYSVDIYRGKLEPVKNILDFGFFVTFFPQLVAGPIVRAADFIPQIYKKLHISREDLGRALLLIMGGLFKKAVISDYIAVNFVDRIFDNPGLYTGIENLVGVYGYAIQIYCDFSGYSDIAIGIGLLLGYRLPINFNAPYKAASITDFWRRWHISLSSWLRDYLYIPLGGNRKGKIRQYANLLTTMLLGGLWHGASWNFVVWGAIHGFLLAVEKLIMEVVKVPKNIFTYLAGVILTFHFVCFAWIFFRARTFDGAGQVIDRIFNDFNFSEPGFKGGMSLELWLIVIGFLIHLLPRNLELNLEEAFIKMPWVAKSVAFFIVVVLIIQIKLEDVQPFIYFQF